MSRKNDKPGLLHHAHPSTPENPYDPDAHRDVLQPQPEIIERAAGESHHGLVRERDQLKLGREEEALLALENTVITPVLAWTMSILFLLTICIPAIWQSSIEVRANIAARKAGENSRVLPKIFDAFDELPSWQQIKAVRSWHQLAALVSDADSFKTHETALEDDSIFVKWMLPRAQYSLAKWGGVGNEQAYIGREGWLFYRPDVDYLTSPGFLDPALLRTRARAGDASTQAVQPDPLRAIIDFRDQLKQRGIEFILMPMPVKPMLEASAMSARYDGNTLTLQNPSYQQFLNALQSAGVLVFDPTPILQSRKAQTNQPQFLQTDTHWTPDTMEAVAQKLSAFIEASTQVNTGQAQYSHRTQTIKSSGDTAVMLGLQKSQDLYGKQTVQIHQVLQRDGILWQRDPNARVLLLGDSFCNIYSLAAMGWGQGAGFGEQLSYYLRQPIDSIVVNAGGSHTSRARLVGEMRRGQKRGKNRLVTTKLVIWEFSMRDLLIGDWRIFTLP